MKHFFYAFILLVPGVIFAQTTYPTGMKFDDEAYNKIRRLSPALKFADAELPKIYSLKSYCPTPGYQNPLLSCVGWATGYAALSISEAIRDDNTNQSLITANARSAMYIYEQLKDDCTEGILTKDALDLILDKGDCYIKDFDPKTCPSIVPDNLHSKAAKLKIKTYYALFETSSPGIEKIIATQKSLLAKKPVIIGINTTASFQNVKADGIWSPSNAEQYGSGHAVCLIGYDDNTKMFEILNSWGTSWGDNGYFKISYDNYVKYCKYAYALILEEKTNKKEITLFGKFNFKKYKVGNFEDAAVRLSGSEYSIDDVYLNDFFRISVSGTKDRFLYLFSIKPDNSAEILFPTQRIVDGATIKDLPVTPATDMVFEIPSDPKRGVTTDMAGNDALIILYSAEELKDIDEIVSKVKNNSGDFISRLKIALGNRLIPVSDIRYGANEMSLTAKSNKGSVAPLILTVNVKQ